MGHGLIPNLINRCAIHNGTLAHRCIPLSRMHKYSLEMVLHPAKLAGVLRTAHWLYAVPAKLLRVSSPTQ
jgi:hypothetical protein